MKEQMCWSPKKKKKKSIKKNGTAALEQTKLLSKRNTSIPL